MFKALSNARETYLDKSSDVLTFEINIDFVNASAITTSGQVTKVVMGNPVCCSVTGGLELKRRKLKLKLLVLETKIKLN